MWPCFSSPDSLLWLPLNHFAQTSPACLQDFLTSRLLKSLFHTPCLVVWKALYPHLHLAGSLLSFKMLLRCHLLREAFHDYLMQNNQPLPLTSHFSYLLPTFYVCLNFFFLEHLSLWKKSETDCLVSKTTVFHGLELMTQPFWAIVPLSVKWENRGYLTGLL